MQSKDGTEAGADTKNRVSIEIYHSGSESEFESVYGTDSDSNATEGPPYNDKSHGLSPLAPTSESSFKLRTSDVISSFTSQHSDITDELVLPASSLTQSPPVQVMDRNGRRHHGRSPVSSFSSESSSPTGSSGSGESLFSLQINTNSFTNHLLINGGSLDSGDLRHLDEMRSSTINSYSFTESEELIQLEELQSASELVKFRQPRPEARGPNISIGETIPRKIVDDHEESSSVELSEGLSRANHNASHQNDFVLPLSFPIAKEKSINENKKKKKKKKKKGGLSNCSCKLCCCLSCSGYSCFPSCSSNCLSCSGCKCSSCSCPKWSYSCNCPSCWNCKRKSSICC